MVEVTSSMVFNLDFSFHNIVFGRISDTFLWLGGKQNMKALNKEAQIDLSGIYITEPTSSLRTVAELTGMSQETKRTTLKIHKFHPCKIYNFKNSLRLVLIE